MYEQISQRFFIKNIKAITKERALAISIVVTLIVMVLEIAYSFIANSLMLFSDGIHMFTHALSLVITLLSIVIMKKTKNKSVELIAVSINGMTLFYFGFYIFFESLNRYVHPQQMEISYTIGVAIIGLVVNVFTAILLNQSGIEDLNMKSAFAHMIADTLMSVSIVFGAIIIYFTKFYFIDAVLSIILSLFIIKWAVDLFRQLAKEFKNSEAFEVFSEKKTFE